MDDTNPAATLQLRIETLESYIELAHTAGIRCEFERLDAKSKESRTAAAATEPDARDAAAPPTKERWGFSGYLEVPPEVHEVEH